MSQVLVGCDPEYFITDGYDFYPACGHLPGTKYEPYEVEDGTVQVDGLAFEMGIKPARNADEFVNRIKKVHGQMNEMVHKAFSKEHYICTVPFVKFDKEVFEALPQEYKVLGCLPDYTSDGEQQVPPEGLENEPFRTASGHVHIGWTQDQDPQDPEHIDECMKTARIHGVGAFFKPTTMLEHKRLKYYGSHNAFRPKPYGVELRAPSNRWLSKETDIRKMYNFIRNTMAQRGF